jgi:hypothetical protein
MERSAFSAGALDAGTIEQAEPETVVVHVQLRPRRGATRKCLAALATLAAEHDEVAFAVTGLSKDDRVVRVTVGVDLGPRTAVAKFSPQAQAAYAFVSAIFASLYDHMPVYTAEPSGAERAAAAVLLEEASRGVSAADVLEGLPASAGSQVPAPRMSSARTHGPGERIPA